MEGNKVQRYRDSTQHHGNPKPSTQRSLGRQVRRFHVATWIEVSERIVGADSYAKSTNSEKLKKDLLGTDERELVEASPFGKI